MPIRPFPSVAALAALTVPAIVSGAHAAPIPESFIYQGVLEDGGTPANGMYDIRVYLYLDAAGGFFIAGSENYYGDVEVVDGRFELDFDFSGVPSVFESQDLRYVEIQVRESGTPGFTILAPRVPVTPAPIAHVALEALEAKHAQSADVSLQDAYDLGDTIELTAQGLTLRKLSDSGEAELSLGSSSSSNERPGALYVHAPNGVINAELRQSTFAEGGWLRLYQAGGIGYAEIEPDITSGGGGYFRINRNENGSVGFEIDGNRGSGEPRVSILGPLRTAVFDMSNGGDDAVDLPTDSISAGEILDEAGAAEAVNTGAVAITPVAATVDVIDSVTINCPSDGVVLVFATLEAQIDHPGGSNTTVNFGISESSASLSGNADIELRIPSTSAGAAYDSPVTVHQAFDVSGAGAQTYYLLADQNSTTGSISAIDTQLTAVYLPTEYGNVSRSTDPQNGTETPDELTSVRGPKTVQEIVSEREQALRVDLARQQRELEAMRREMAEIKQSLKNANKPQNQQ